MPNTVAAGAATPMYTRESGIIFDMAYATGSLFGYGRCNIQ